MKLPHKTESKLQGNLTPPSEPPEPRRNNTSEAADRTTIWAHVPTATLPPPPPGKGGTKEAFQPQAALDDAEKEAKGLAHLDVRTSCSERAYVAAVIGGTATSPAHYEATSIQPIDVMRANLSAEQFEGVLRGNVIKYIIRYPHKGGVHDLLKARVYLDWLIAHLDNQP